jgi:hypothetical protein
VAEGALAVETVNLTDVALTVFAKERAQCDIDRDPLGEERQPLAAEIGVDACLRGDGSARRDPGHQAADVGSRGGHGDSEGAGLAVARRD